MLSTMSGHRLIMLSAAALLAVAMPLHADPLVRVRTDLGEFFIDLQPDHAPASVDNFLGYLRDGDYDRSFVHRSVPDRFVQGGLFRVNEQGMTERVPADPPVINEPGLSNLRGTVALAKIGDDPNSATSEWFVNLFDSNAGGSASLDTQNGGFTVFGRVIDDGMAVVDVIAGLDIWDAGDTLNEVPLLDFPGDVPLTGEYFVYTELAEFARMPVAPQASVLPATRAVQVGTAATGFATIINASEVTAASCRIAPVTQVDAAFFFDITDPETNASLGFADQPVDIAAGASQTFIFSLTPNAPIAATEIEFSFDCGNSDPAQPLVGVNTFLLSSSDIPVPDLVALSTTGLVTIPGETATGIMAVAVSNIGVRGVFTVSADTGDAVLPLTSLLCRTDAAGDCMDTPAASVTVDLPGNGAASFGVFITTSGPIAFDPAAHRLFVRFADEQGVIRGATSAAVRTGAAAATAGALVAGQ